MADRQGRPHPRRARRVVGLAIEDGDAYACGALVVTTGTFLNGLIHIGPEQRPAGRAGEPPSRELAESLKSFGFEWGRLKTGTPPRLDRDSIDFDRRFGAAAFMRERGDDPPVPFSFLTERDRPRRRSTATCCTRTIASTIWCARTSIARRSSTARSAASARATVRRSRTRSCVSRTRSGTRSFSSPKGSTPREIYVNGFSMSLPRDVQERTRSRAAGPRGRRAAAARLRGRIRLHSADGADAAPRNEARRGPVSRRPDQRHVGYEEAAAQGIVAGINAAQRSRALRRVRARGATRRTSASWSTT